MEGGDAGLGLDRDGADLSQKATSPDLSSQKMEATCRQGKNLKGAEMKTWRRNPQAARLHQLEAGSRGGRWLPKKPPSGKANAP